MRYFLTRYLACLLSVYPAIPVYAADRAVERIVADEISGGCEGPGRFDDAGVREVDLTGDGKLDLIVDHDGLTCQSGRSLTCGIRRCSVLVYVRYGNQLVLKLDVLSVGAEIGGGTPRRIILRSDDFRERAVRWNGSAFK